MTKELTDYIIAQFSNIIAAKRQQFGWKDLVLLTVRHRGCCHFHRTCVSAPATRISHNLAANIPRWVEKVNNKTVLQKYKKVGVL